MEHVSRYEGEFLEFLNADHADLMLEIAQKQEVSDETAERLRGACETFTGRFTASLQQQAAS